MWNGQEIEEIREINSPGWTTGCSNNQSLSISFRVSILEIKCLLKYRILKNLKQQPIKKKDKKKKEKNKQIFHYMYLILCCFLMKPLVSGSTQEDT